MEVTKKTMSLAEVSAELDRRSLEAQAKCKIIAERYRLEAPANVHATREELQHLRPDVQSLIDELAYVWTMVGALHSNLVTAHTELARHAAERKIVVASESDLRRALAARNGRPS